jgi:hypothetical protein
MDHPSIIISHKMSRRRYKFFAPNPTVWNHEHTLLCAFHPTSSIVSSYSGKCSMQPRIHIISPLSLTLWTINCRNRYKFAINCWINQHIHIFSTFSKSYKKKMQMHQKTISTLCGIQTDNLLFTAYRDKALDLALSQRLVSPTNL